MLLVTFNQDWADEFSVYGLALMSEDSFEQLLKWAKNASYHFGSNEGWEDEDISDGFSSLPVTKEEILVLRKTIFGTFDTFGCFPNWQELIYDQIYNQYEIIENNAIVFADTGLLVAFGFGSWDEANEALHKIVESKI